MTKIKNRYRDFADAHPVAVPFATAVAKGVAISLAVDAVVTAISKKSDETTEED